MLKTLPRRLISAFLLTALLATSAITGPAFAAKSTAVKKNFAYAINLVGRQRMLAEMMAKQTVLIGLKVDVPLNLSYLQENRKVFQQVLKGMREGDFELALPGTTNPEILAKLERVEALWPEFEAAVRKTLESGKVEANQIDALTAVNQPLVEALNDTVKTYEKVASTGGLFSILEMSIDHSAQLRMLSQKITKEVALIAYGYRPSQSKAGLAGSVESFDRTLNGLVNGDFDLLLLPAPTPEIRAQLAHVRSIWDALRPLAQSGIVNSVGPEQVKDATRLSEALLKEANRAVLMYEAL